MNEQTLKFNPAQELIDSLVIVTMPNGNKTVNIKRGKRRDRVVIAAAEAMKVDAFTIPEDEQAAE
jgi:hypothetical protein